MTDNKKKTICRILFILSILVYSIAIFITHNLWMLMLLVFIFVSFWIIDKYKNKNNISKDKLEIKKYKKIICYIRAILRFIKIKEWCPHIYKQSIEPAIIISTPKTFRISNNYIHNANETVHPNAGLIKCTCKICGYTTFTWFSDWEQKYKYE